MQEVSSPPNLRIQDKALKQLMGAAYCSRPGVINCEGNGQNVIKGCYMCCSVAINFFLLEKTRRAAAAAAAAADAARPRPAVLL